MPEYAERGYCPAEASGGAVARTLEFGWDDFALGNLAAALGHTEDAQRFSTRAREGWRHHLDPASGFLVGRTAAGELRPQADPVSMDDRDYVEGNAWHYQWLVPHDIAGLSEALGGVGPFVAKLDRFFDGAREAVTAAEADGRAIDAIPNPYYWHGNEPDIHAPWLYSAVGRPGRASDEVRWIARTYYDATPAGLAGNDDCGTLSAWYLFAAAGLYPVAGSTQYLLSAPLFDRVEWRPPGGAGPLVFQTTAAVAEHPYPAAAWAGRHRLPSAAVDHRTLLEAGGLLFDLSTQAAAPWAPAPAP